MGLPDNDIIKLLGLQGVVVESLISCDQELKLVIYCRQIKELCRCHECGNSIEYVHEWKLRKLRAPPLGIYQEVWIYLKQLRGNCHLCGDRVRSSRVPFVHPQFQNLLLSLCEHAGRLMEDHVPSGGKAAAIKS